MPSMDESLAIADLADHLYDYLPGSPHPYANADISFPGVAKQLGLGSYWTGGSKRPALAALLTSVVTHQRGKFCPFIVAVVKAALVYRRSKTPLCREDINELNKLVLRFGFKIPELYDNSFLDRLPKRQQSAPAPQASQVVDAAARNAMAQKLVELANLRPQERGFAFERFLGDLFEAFGLSPRASFRLVGEQIDGSLTLDGEYYLVEAKWHDTSTGIGDLLTFSGKVGGKSTWARGVFVSYSGYSADGLEAYSRGRATNIVCFDGLDLHDLLSRGFDLREVLRAKLRRAAETSRAFIAVRELFP